MKTNFNRKITKEVVKLFDNQIETLASLDVPASVITDPLISLIELRENLVLKVVENFSSGNFSGNIWFVPVIPLSIVNISIQAQFLQFNGNKGYSYFKNEDVFDLVSVPKNPYYLLGISEGKKNYRNVPNNFLTLAESIALCLHSNVLERNYIKALGSRYNTLNESPIIHIYQGEHPKIDWDYFEEGESDNFLKVSEPCCSERLY